MILPTALTTAGAAAIINLWLGIRIGQVRTREKISVGDGGNEALIRRMRAQANFIESTPIVLIMLALVELAKGPSMWLWIVASVYLLARIAHAFGMDGVRGARMAGTLGTMLVALGLAIAAIAIPHMSAGEVTPVAVDPAMETVPQG